MATNPYFSYSITGEQDLHESLVVEQIKMFGRDVYYIPRTLYKEDHVFGEDTISKFNGAYVIEAYIADTTGFGGDGELYSKFGLRITDQMEFVISRKRFTEAVDVNTTLIIEGRPNEGDLIWFPLAKKLFQINFVEYESPFYQFGKNFVWNLKTEIFEYSDENLNTGIADIDNIETTTSQAVTITLATGGTGVFSTDEIITIGTSGVTAQVKSWNPTNRQLVIYNRTGKITAGETIIGQTSLASWVAAYANLFDNVNSEYDDNSLIEDEANALLDFTEHNPFGEVGNTITSGGDVPLYNPIDTDVPTVVTSPRLVVIWDSVTGKYKLADPDNVLSDASNVPPNPNPDGLPPEILDGGSF
jgi:hypothetical protein